MLDLYTRTIGEYTTARKGPLLLVLGGIHGNEPSGVLGLRKVFRQLKQRAPASFCGKLLGLSGNLNALRQKKRYIDFDLNRLWSSEHIDRIKQMAPAARRVEERELLELLAIMERELAKDYTEVVLMDLHTTSGSKGLFSIVTRSEENQELASALHAPVLFDLATSLSTTTSRFMDDQGIKGVAFEAGQHEEPAAVNNQEAAIWLMLEKLGMINSEGRHFDTDPYHRQLIVASSKLPHFVRVIYRHDIAPEDQFHMYPGYTNFHEVYKGEPVACDKNGPILCPASGLMLMPLYQSQGSDGFFIMEKLLESPLINGQ